MKTITPEEIPNCELSDDVKSGDIVGRHKYEGSQVDWYVRDSVDQNIIWAWYGAPGATETTWDQIDALDEYRVTLT